MRILFDLDDVVIDLVPSWLALYNQDYGDDLTKEEIIDWAIPQLVKPECGAKILTYLDLDAVYDQAQEVEGALVVLKRLVDAGYNVWFLTARYSESKFRFLEEHGVFDIVPRENVIVSHHKYLIQGDILVDDYHQNILSFPGYGILFDQPWNRKIDYPHRARNWEDVYQEIVHYEEERSEPMHIPGMGRDTEMVVNDNGGRQSKLDYRFDLVEPLAFFNLANVLAEGATTHGVDNWKSIPVRDHLNHAIAHIYAWLAGDRQDNHLGHAFCRLMFALWQELSGHVS